MSRNKEQVMNQANILEISYPDSPNIGKFLLPYELIRDGARRPILQALFGLCVILHTEPHESGRGMTYYAASDLFQPLMEGEEIPQYRIEHAWNMPFPDPEHEARRVNGQNGIGFVAIRNFIIRAPVATYKLASALPEVGKLRH